MRTIFGKLVRNITKSERGGTLVYFALAMPVVMGFAGLGFDATMWFMERRILQNATDAAAMAATYSLSKGGDGDNLTAAASTDSARNNFPVGGQNIMVVENPPTSGSFAGQSNYVMVNTSMPAAGYFSAAFGMNQGTIDTSATAGILAVGEHCILALSDTRDQAISMSGSAVITLDCGIASNSNSSQSIYLNGHVEVTADPSLQAFGDIYEGGSSTLNIPNPIQPFSQKVEDPYSDLTVPSSPTACTETNYDFPKNNSQRSSDPYWDSGKNAYVFPPGRYCGDFDLSLNSSTKGDIILEPGTYIIDGGDFNIGSQSNIQGDGVTIILTADDPSNIGNMDINGGADVDLSPPTTGDYTGVLIYQDQAAEYAENANTINGGSNMALNGAVYFPSQEVRFLGNSGNSSGCTMLIGDKVTFTGNNTTTITNDDAVCTALGVKKPARTIVTLVE